MNKNNYTEALFKILNEEVKDLWKVDEDKDFLREIAEDIAEQHIKLKSVNSKEEREICLTNIEHLKTQIKGRIAQKKNHLIDKGEIILNKVINLVIKVGSAVILG